MGANSYYHFKNRDLMNLFKRLGIQNQQRKFNALWKMLNQFTADNMQAVEGARSAVKPFSHWIRGTPKGKLSLLYDSNGIWYGIQTTNHVECFNMVLHRVRGFPLVGIVDFIMYDCMRYFRERYMAASLTMNNPQMQFCTKPRVFHLPCSHIIATCGVSGLQVETYMSPYFTKEVAFQTWSHEVYGVRIIGSYTQENKVKAYKPNPMAKKGKGRQAGKAEKHCNQCGALGHNYKRCPKNAHPNAACRGRTFGESYKWSITCIRIYLGEPFMSQTLRVITIGPCLITRSL
ncbi:hypothetical protein BS78_06G070800 [Paspalum vaginatum]|nr:hypothetical protein BS78_06G070800 [Paspalum vaginatum]